MAERHLTDPTGRSAAQGNLLIAAIRRDITDLNRLFLDCALDPALCDDRWFRLPDAARSRFTRAGPDARERAACSPVALFELSLPTPDSWVGLAVADDDDEAVDRGRAERRRSFGLAVLQVLRRMAEDMPLSPRIAFGLAPVEEARARALTLSESYRLAGWAGLIQPRWPGHARYWGALAEAANAAGADILHWAYSAGLCLLGQCERQPAAFSYAPHRPPRPSHRRSRPGGSDVPC